MKILDGKRGIIFGALDERSIAWQVAEKAHAHGARFTLTNVPVAVRFGTVGELASDLGVELIPADATKVDELRDLLQQSMDQLGGPLDFVLHSIGMSPNVRKASHTPVSTTTSSRRRSTSRPCRSTRCCRRPGRWMP